MKTSFSILEQDQLRRTFGGTTVGTADPYLTGLFGIQFAKLPAALESRVNPYDISSNNEVRKILAGTCISVTPPGGTLNSQDYTGLGGIKSGVPSNIDYGNVVTLRFVEMNGIPVFRIIHEWFKMIRDYRFGASNLQETASLTGYSKRTFSGLLYYWTTAPDAKTVEFAACYDGVYPTKDPQDLFGSDIDTVGRLDIDIDFHIDTPWQESWVKTKCQEFAD